MLEVVVLRGWASLALAIHLGVLSNYITEIGNGALRAMTSKMAILLGRCLAICTAPRAGLALETSLKRLVACSPTCRSGSTIQADEPPERSTTTRGVVSGGVR